MSATGSPEHDMAGTTPRPGPTSTPVLAMRGVGKHYGRVSALRGIDLSVRRGEVTCVLGDNGAGKSTLIKIMSGLHDYDEGSMPHWLARVYRAAC